MMNCVSTLNVLSKLVVRKGSIIIAFDPYNTLVKDEGSSFLTETSIYSLKQRINGLRQQRLNKLRDSQLCVFHLGRDRLEIEGIDCLVELESRNDYPQWRKTTWNYINNPNGTPRWLFPSGITQPWFLSFYNFTYWKARLYKALVRAAFFCRLPNLITSGRLIIHSADPVFAETLLAPSFEPEKQYAIFTGTAGPNRKAVLAEVREGKIHSFLKIGLNRQSAGNLMNEYQSLSALANNSIPGTVIPLVEMLNDHAIRVSNVKPSRGKKQKEFGLLEWQFLHGLYRHSPQEQPYREIPVTGETRIRLRQLAVNSNLEERGHAKQLLLKLIALDKSLELLNPLIKTAVCHGDFTPWNRYRSGNTLFVYDWEFSRPGMPLLFDLFHYVIQGNVFSQNASAADIQRQLDLLFLGEPASLFVKEYKTDRRFYLQLYLLYNAAYYLDIYLTQDTLHKEGYRLFEVWNDLLDALPAPKPAISLRTTFIRDFFPFLLPANYVVLKNAGKSMLALSEGSDIDILIDGKVKNETITWVSNYPGIQKMTCTRKSFMTTLQLFFTDNSFLSIDLLTAFHRKSLEYIPARLLLDNSIMVNGVRSLPPIYDYLYIYLFYQLNASDIPEKYTTCFDGLSPEDQEKVQIVLQQETGLHADRLSETFTRSEPTRKGIVRFLRQKPRNRWPFRLIRGIRYMGDFLSERLFSKGVMLTFSGVDGAGKSTVLGEVRELLQKKYRRKVVVIRHRPSILPILSAWKYGKEQAEKKCIESLPRQGGNKSYLSSLLRFAYYYTDYLLGQFIVYTRYTLRGYVVLYDRYYFDFIADSKRSNIRVNPAFIRQLYRFVYKPQLNVFLYAAPEVILRRKQELSADDIITLTHNYQDLFRRLGDPQHYMCIENNDKQTTIDRIEQAYILLN